MGTFLDDSEELGLVIHRQAEAHQPATFSSQLSSSNSHLDFFSLAARKTGRHMEPFIIDIQPAPTHEPILSSHEGEEFIFVLQVAVKINYGKYFYVLNQGDSIYYDSKRQLQQFVHLSLQASDREIPLFREAKYFPTCNSVISIGIFYTQVAGM